jgi:hypothetical protein
MQIRKTNSARGIVRGPPAGCATAGDLLKPARLCIEETDRLRKLAGATNSIQYQRFLSRTQSNGASP